MSSDQQQQGDDIGQFVGFMGLLVVVTMYLVPAIVVIFLFNGFDLEEAWSTAFQSSPAFVGCSFFWAVVLWRWATAKDKLR